MAYLERSRDDAEREEKEREAARQRELERAQKFAEAQAKVARLFKRFAGSLAVGLCLAIALTIWAFKLRQEARTQETAAKEQRAVAQQKEREALQQQQRAELGEAKTAYLLYGANMNLVQASFEQLNNRMAARLLEQTHTRPNRGFEWYYWQRQFHRETRSSGAMAVASSGSPSLPDGRHILTGGEDGLVIIRDVASGEQKLKVEAGSFQQFSPDGTRFLTGNGNTPARVLQRPDRRGAARAETGRARNLFTGWEESRHPSRRAGDTLGFGHRSGVVVLQSLLSFRAVVL